MLVFIFIIMDYGEFSVELAKCEDSSSRYLPIYIPSYFSHSFNAHLLHYRFDGAFSLVVSFALSVIGRIVSQVVYL